MIGATMPDLHETDKASLRSRSVSEVRFGSRVFDTAYRRSCKTCTSPARFELEKSVVLGAGFAETAREFADSGVTARNLSEHFGNRHVDLESDSVAELRLEHAAEIRRQHLGLIGGSLYDQAAAVSAEAVDAMATTLADLASVIEDGTVLEAGFQTGLETDERDV